MGRGPRWTVDDIRELVDGIAIGRSHSVTAGLLGRSYESVKSKVHELMRGRGRMVPITAISAPSAFSAHLLTDRDRRLAVQPRDLTALVCGDPLPGESALDRRLSP